MKFTVKILSTILLAALLVGCNATKRIVYDFNKEASVKALLADGQIRIKPLDRLIVVVSSQNPELAAPFNAPTSYNSLSNNPIGSTSVNGMQSLQVRTVGEDGTMEFPMIGKIQCQGKTREELSKDIAKKIIEGNYISDAYPVALELADVALVFFTITIIGSLASFFTANKSIKNMQDVSLNAR